jgi:Imm-5 like putative immunity protein
LQVIWAARRSASASAGTSHPARDRPPGSEASLGGVSGCVRAALRCWADAVIEVPTMILPKVRDPRFVTIRRGGTLTDSDHHLLALWAASCAEHVLDLFESAQPEDPRPREAIEHARAWVRGEVKMMQARAAGGHAMGAARDLRGAARYAAYAAGQAGAVAHVAAHELGAAAYAIKAARAAAPEGESEAAGRSECRLQRDQLPEAIRELVLDDQRLRNEICWSVFDR